jgi:hypothetical protein
MMPRVRTVAGRASSLFAASVCALMMSVATAADSPPDLSGIWTWDREANRGAGRGLQLWPQDPPFTPEAREKVAAYQALVRPTGDTPGGWCVGYGMPTSTLSSGGYPLEIIQRPEQITMIHEAHNEIRRIYLDERKNTDPKDLIPTRNGFSVGRWEGDTLIVETTMLKEAVDQSAAHSDEAHILEKYWLSRDAKGRKILNLELTLTDPRFYTKPVTVRRTWVAAEPGTRMLDYECNEPAWEDHLRKLAEEAQKNEESSTAAAQAAGADAR